MRNFLGLAIVLFSFICSCNSSQKVIAQIDQEQSLAANENALLWKVMGNDLKETSYVFGTIHMIEKEDFFLTESMKKAFAASDRVVF